MQIPQVSLVVRRNDDGYHSVLINGIEIGTVIKAHSLRATYDTSGGTEVTMTIVVDDFRADERK